MTERHIAKHTVRISFKAGDGLTDQLICHGDKNSACWWPLDEDGHPDQGDHCSLVKWQEEDWCISGEIELPVEVVSWDEDGPVMELRPAESTKFRFCTGWEVFVAGDGEKSIGRAECDMMGDHYHKEGE